MLYDSAEDASKLVNHADREEIAAALKNGTGTSVRYSSTLSEKTIYYAVTLNSGEILRVSTEETSLWSIFMGLIQYFVIIRGDLRTLVLRGEKAETAA